MCRGSKLLLIVAAIAALSSFGGVDAAQAQAAVESLTAVCLFSFESPIQVVYLTDDEITEIIQLERDPSEIPLPEIVGFPDLATGSCATENGELLDYDPKFTTPICVPSGPDGDGPLIVMFYSNHYLPSYAAYNNVIFADSVTGACLNQLDPAPSGDADALVDALVDKLRNILRDALA